MIRAARFILPVCFLFGILIFGLVASGQSTAQAPAMSNSTASQSTPAFDVHTAVEAYLAKMPPDERARSDAYFEGGYWLILWDFVVTAVVMWILLQLQWSAGMRNFAARMTRFRSLQTAIYWFQFFIVASVLTFPWDIYENYVREHKYGLVNQTFGPWLRDQVVALAVGVILGGILVVPLFGLMRRLGKSWWIWGAALAIVFLAFVSLIAPVYIAPLFNKYTVLRDARVKDPILSMARANGIPATDVYEFDASRQSNRVSANVSGFAGTQRISLNDNLLHRCTLPEIETTMGHEMGHYVLGHVREGMVFSAVLLLVFVFAAFHLLRWSVRRWGSAWGLRGADDWASLPVLLLLLSICGFLVTPIANAFSRHIEHQADQYGLEVVHGIVPDAPEVAAQTFQILGDADLEEPAPSWLTKVWFYTHPSIEERILFSRSYDPWSKGQAPEFVK